MKKFAYLLAGISCWAIVLPTAAQLPSNPWQNNSAPTQVRTMKQQPAVTSKIEEMGRKQAIKAQQFREAQTLRASTTLENQRAESRNNNNNSNNESNNNGTTTQISVKTIEPDSDIIPVDPWARARDRSGVTTWRGSGQHGKLNYIGEATTYGDAVGQEMIAPEVNRHNMVVMTQHFRNLGYKIPDSYDQKIRDLPQSYAKHLREAYDGLGHQNNPFDTMFSGFLDVVEEQSGLDMENILFNSIDLLSTD